jgi:hypothetical protein
MSSTVNIVLPTLTNWAKSHISAIIEATTQADLNAALNAFLSDNASITVNGVNFSRDQYKNFLQGETFRETAATLAFSGEVGVPTDPSSNFDVSHIFCTRVRRSGQGCCSRALSDFSTLRLLQRLFGFVTHPYSTS